ncbi:MAG: hypothetical protein ACRC8Y_25435 [Chroococcales cyanobacterium]
MKLREYSDLGGSIKFVVTTSVVLHVCSNDFSRSSPFVVTTSVVIRMFVVTTSVVLPRL